MPRATPKTSSTQPSAVTLTESEVWHGALHMIQRYGEDAVNEARHRLDVFASQQELDAQLAWLRIIEAISWLQDDQPQRAGIVH